MSVYEKKELIARVNYKNHSYFKYNYKNDTVIEDFNSKAMPIPFDQWKSEYAV